MLLPLGIVGVGLVALTAASRANQQRALFFNFDYSRWNDFVSALPAEAKPYADIIKRVSQAKGVSPLLLAMFGYSETRWGTGAGYSPKGAAGKGDSGHGHGIFQIDDRSHADWLSTNAWWDAEVNAGKALDIYKSNLKFFSGRGTIKGHVEDGLVKYSATVAPRFNLGDKAVARNDPRPLHGATLLRASLAAYNTGALNVLRSIAAGLDPDHTTAHKSYSANILTRGAEVAAKLG